MLSEYVRLREMTGRDSYFPDVVQVEAYQDAIEKAELVELIQKGRKEARAARERSFEVSDDDRTVAVDWEGEPLLVPEPGPLARLRHRLTGKAPLPAMRLRSASSGLQQLAKDALKVTALEAPGGSSWVVMDVGSELEYGSVVALTAESIVQGPCAILVKEGVQTLCRLARNDQVDSVLGGHQVELGSVTHAKGCATPLGDRARAPPVGQDALAVALESSQHARAKVEEEDLRTNWIDYDEHGVRFKTWRQVLAESTM